MKQKPALSYPQMVLHVQNQITIAQLVDERAIEKEEERLERECGCEMRIESNWLSCDRDVANK